jgi:ABC-type xylose transport system permease subunit
MRSFLSVAVVGLFGFVAAFCVVLFVWGTGDGDCEGDACVLEWAVVVNAAIIVGLLVGAVAAFATYMLLRIRSRRAPTA